MGVSNSTSDSDFSPKSNKSVTPKNDYWDGPYDIKVPSSIHFIVAIDGHNTLSDSGYQTQRDSNVSEPSEAQYKKLYATLGLDGRYYYKVPRTQNSEPITKEIYDGLPGSLRTSSVHPSPSGDENGKCIEARTSLTGSTWKQLPKPNKQNSELVGYWIGPFGIKVPNRIYFVTAPDQHNTIDKLGSKTETWSEDSDCELTEAEYKELYAERGPDGYYYWKQ